MGTLGTGMMTTGAEQLGQGFQGMFTQPSDPYAGTQFGINQWEL